MIGLVKLRVIYISSLHFSTRDGKTRDGEVKILVNRLGFHIFVLCNKRPKPALGSTLPTMQLLPGVKQLGREEHHSFPSVPTLRISRTTFALLLFGLMTCLRKITALFFFFTFIAKTGT